jgi:Eukaryotic protein of unknown function (DUF842)
MLSTTHLTCVRLPLAYIHMALCERRQEIGQFQNRLSRAMQECEDKARDQMRPGFEQDAKLMSKVEDTLIGCVESTVNEYIAKLKPLKERIVSQLK